MFKFRCNIFIGVRIIKEMPGSAESGTPCIMFERNLERRVYNTCMFSVFLEIIHKFKNLGAIIERT